MKNLVIATAVASVFAASAASAAGHGAGPAVKVSGIVQTYYKIGDAVTNVAAGDVRLNIAASQETSTGSTVFANYRLDADGLSGTALTADSVKVGVKADFGTITLGNNDAATALAEFAGDMDVDPSPSIPSVVYTNSFDAVTVAAGISPDGDADATTVGVQFAADAFTAGFGMVASDKIGDYSMVGASVPFGDFGFGITTGTVGTGPSTDADYTAFKVSWASGDISASFQSETTDLGAGMDGATNQIDVAYALSSNASIKFRNYDDSDDSTAAFNRVGLSLAF